MNVNKNGIPVHTPKKKNQRRKPLSYKLETRRFRLIDDEAEDEVVLPLFSPIIKLMEQDGWEEVK